MKKALFAAIIFILIFSFTACNKEVERITDFDRFSDMTRECEKIEVTFDNYSGYPFYFTIEKEADIEEIMDILFSATFKNMGKELNGGDHTSLKIFQGDKTYSISTFMNKEDGYYYAFTSTELADKIIDLATKAGAYESAS